jgi:hypothetical protein
LRDEPTVIVSVSVEGPIDAKLLAEELGGGRFDLRRVGERPKRIGECQQECLSLLAIAQRRFGSLPIFDVDGVLGDGAVAEAGADEHHPQPRPIVSEEFLLVRSDMAGLGQPCHLRFTDAHELRRRHVAPG